MRSEKLVDALLDWFDGRDRDVPWRDESDPFAILVAEVMAQQTRMESVRPYYHRFRERFPDAASLAAADQDEVLKLWEGLGYYARARNLHAAARVIVKRHDGVVPSAPEALRSLPGVGPYTAGAVASIAFGAPEPAVDGNTRRVLGRLFDLERPSPAALERTARELLAAAPSRAAAVNQALMDLGSLVCTPKNPGCERCPVARGCLALGRGTVPERPAAKKTAPKRARFERAVATRNGSKTLVARRRRDGLLGGLWEFPSVVSANEASHVSRRSLATDIERAFGFQVGIGPARHDVTHAFSHFRLSLEVHEARWVSGRLPDAGDDGSGERRYAEWAWCDEMDLERIAVPVYLRRLISSGALRR
ncbi:MAG: A/G-specific adenine glycosylase [Gemmatimonadetes bacterium]|nr:A/G-specific adenine glycosylase [Gemmatimonadota bacterium]